MSSLVASNLEASMQTLPAGWVWQFSSSESTAQTRVSGWRQCRLFASTSRCFQISISYLLPALLTQGNSSPYSSPALSLLLPGALVPLSPTFSGTDFHQLYIFPLPWFPFLLCTDILMCSPLKQTERNKQQETFHLILFSFSSLQNFWK